jgi:hypothetical protein
LSLEGVVQASFRRSAQLGATTIPFYPHGLLGRQQATTRRLTLD